MSKIAVFYQSKYGSTKKYAEWIASELKCDLHNASTAKKEDLLKYDVIIYGGGLYASGINGISLITHHFEVLKQKEVVVFTVGLADPEIKQQFQPILDKNFTEEMKKSIKIFHLRGSMNYKKLGLVHKSMMAMLKKVISKKKENELTEDDKMMLATYGDVVDFTDKKATESIISYIKGLKI